MKFLLFSGWRTRDTPESIAMPSRWRSRKLATEISPWSSIGATGRNVRKGFRPIGGVTAGIFSVRLSRSGLDFGATKGRVSFADRET